VHDELKALVALAPGDGRLNALVRRTCATTLGLPPLPAEVKVEAPGSEAEAVVAEFAEQFSVDVSVIGDELRGRLGSALGADVLCIAVLVFVADYVPRVRAGLQALGMAVPWADGPVDWDHDSDPADVLFSQFLPGVARMRGLDPVTSEIVRLRGASQHNCRLCKSLREGNALDAGGSESLYDQIDRYEAADGLTDAQKAALRYVDALIWSPATIAPEVAAGVREHFSEGEAIELTMDVMRNASNKIAVSLAADAPRVEHGTERYVIDADGQTVFA
jgi:alkylhydroperoxidase family enzyme